MNTKNVLFYSPMCMTCNNFLNRCSKLDILKKFQIIDVTQNIEYYMKLGIRKVPSITIDGSNKLIEAGECMNWLNNVEIAMRQYGMNKYDNVVKSKGIFDEEKPVELPTNKEDEIVRFKFDGFLSNEMNSVSDNYAYKDKDNAFPMSFQTRNLNFEIKTLPEQGLNDRSKRIKEKDTKQLCKNIDFERKNDSEKYCKIMKEQYDKYKDNNNPYFLTG